MLKFKVVNIVLYLLAKYAAFFIVLAFLEDRFKSIVINNSDNKNELFLNTIYYSLYPAIILIVFTFIFTIPLYFLMKKKGIYFILLYMLFIIVEYILYTYLASPSDLTNGIYNGAIGVLFLILFFYNHIRLMFK
jgi:hypothetical protein